MKQRQTFLLICIALILGSRCADQTAEPTRINSQAGSKEQGEGPSQAQIAQAKQVLVNLNKTEDPVAKTKKLEEVYRLVKDAADDSLINAILFELAFNASVSGDWAKGFEWAMTGMDRIGSDSTSYVFPTYANMIAQSFEKQRDYAAALEWAKKSIRSMKGKDIRLYRPENRWAAWMVAAKYMAWLHYPLDSCLHYARESMRLGRLDSIPEDLFANSYVSMAIAFEVNDRPDSAIAYFHRALAMSTKIGGAFAAQEIERYMATLFLRNNQPDSALFYARKAYEAAPAINNWDVRMDAANIMSIALENTDKGLSLAYLREYQQLKDSLFNREKFNTIALIRTNEQLKARDAEEKARRLRNRIITYSLLAGLALMAITGLSLYRNNQVRKKANRQLEQKNRELEIEAALEKVRTRTMEMHQSAELRDVITVFFEKMNELNLLLGTVGIALFEKETGHLWYWIGNAIQDPQLIYVPYDETMMQEENFVRDGWEAMTQKRELINKVYNREQKDSYFNHLFSNNSLTAIPEQARQFLREIDRHTVCFFPNNHSALFADGWDERQYPEAHVAILRRASQVFEQAYVRFLDLQKAEAQSREAEIQLGLERLRSRTMAMHQSEELSDVASVMYQQLSLLGADLWICGFNICHPDKRLVEAWISPPGGQTMEPLYLPIEIDPFTKAGFRAWQEKSGIYTDIDEGQSLKEEHETLLANPVMERARRYIDEHQIALPNWVQRFAVPYSYGYLTIVTRKEFRETEVLQRFATVFDQTYTRFLDLQRAEAQAREAQIEAALERVRSSAMAMQHSDQLPGVVGLMYRQFEELQFGLYQVLVSIFDLDKGVIEWWSKGFGEDNLPQRNIIPIIDHPFPNQQRDAWKSGIEYRAYDLEGEMKSSWEQYLFTQTDLRQFPEHVKAQMRGIDRVCLSDAYMKCGVLQAAGTQQLSEKQADILVRFARVLDLSYTRMMDLQKAESQAREAQVEAALEKVRSKSLAMQKSSELEQVAISLFDGLAGLGVSMNGALIFVFNHEKKDINLWVATTQMSKPVNISLPYDETYSKNDILQELWKSANDRGTGLNRIFSKDAQQEYYRYVHKYNAYHIPEEVARIHQTSTWNFTYASECYTMIGVDSWSGHLFSEMQLTILKSFSRVFEQAYIRFLDLQKAESQAREAMKQASLDRVRGEIASMRSEKDLDRITPLVWTELHNLGIRFSRCGIFIMDIPNQEVNIFLSSPEGKSIAAFDLDFRKINLQQVVEHWKKRENFVTHWNQQEFAELADILVHEQIISDQWQYLDSIPNTGLYLHYIRFLQGMLYVAHAESLGQDELELVQSLADSFSVAYARYEDFTRMEAAKLQTEQALHELKQTQAQLIQAEKMASLGELTAGIAHEIQNPLNFVNNFSDLNKELIEELQEELKKGDVREASSIAENLKDNEEKINLHGRRADGIVKSMLQHSRSSSGQKEPTDVNKLVDEYVRLAYHGYRARKKDFNVRLDIQLDPEVGKVPMVAQDIGRVILNLLNNAFQAVEEKARTAGPEYQPTVSIKTHFGNEEFANAPMRKSVLIRVADNGPGIPDPIKDKIFQPFFTTKPTGQGTGLGLSLSYDIVKAHGGDLEMTSGDEHGTEFRVGLPA